MEGERVKLLSSVGLLSRIRARLADAEMAILRSFPLLLNHPFLIFHDASCSIWRSYILRFYAPALDYEDGWSSIRQFTSVPERGITY